MNRIQKGILGVLIIGGLAYYAVTPKNAPDCFFSQIDGVRNAKLAARVWYECEDRFKNVVVNKKSNMTVTQCLLKHGKGIESDKLITTIFTVCKKRYTK